MIGSSRSSAVATGASRRREALIAGVLLAPSVAVLATFVVYPMIRAVERGRQRCDALGQRCRATGWSQYVDVVTSAEFVDAVGVTLLLALVTVPVGVAVGLGLALLAERRIRGITVFKVMVSSTAAMSVIVASVMWAMVLRPSPGALLEVGWLRDLVPVLKHPETFEDPSTALVSVAISTVWMNIGFSFIVMSAALARMPRELTEAAILDGATVWRRFTGVTAPWLAPVIVFVTVALSARAMHAYGQIDVLTQGGPRPGSSTTTVVYLTYGDSVPGREDRGLQAGVAVASGLVLLGVSFAQLWLIRRVRSPR